MKGIENKFSRIVHKSDNFYKNFTDKKAEKAKLTKKVICINN